MSKPSSGTGNPWRAIWEFWRNLRKAQDRRIWIFAGPCADPDKLHYRCPYCERIAHSQRKVCRYCKRTVAPNESYPHD